MNIMEAIQLTSQKDKFLISLDKKYFDKETIYNLLDTFRIEYLAKKVNFDASIEVLGEEIKSNWWKENKEKFLKRNK